MPSSVAGIVFRGAVLFVGASFCAVACSKPEAFNQRPGLGDAGLSGSTGGAAGGTNPANGGTGGDPGSIPTTSGAAGSVDPNGGAGSTGGGGGQTSMGADAAAGAGGGGGGGTAGGTAGTTGSAHDGGVAGRGAAGAAGGAAGAAGGADAGVTGAAGAPIDAGGGATVEYTGIVATSSSNEPNTSLGNVEPKLAVDGIMTTRWSSGYTDNEWLTLDLGATKQISRVTIFWEAAYGKAFNIRVSNNNTTWTTLRSVTNGMGGTEDLTALAGSGRYVQMQGVTRALTLYGYSIWEIQVYGTTP